MLHVKNHGLGAVEFMTNFRKAPYLIGAHGPTIMNVLALESTSLTLLCSYKRGSFGFLPFLCQWLISYVGLGYLGRD